MYGLTNTSISRNSKDTTFQHALNPQLMQTEGYYIKKEK